MKGRKRPPHKDIYVLNQLPQIFHLFPKFVSGIQSDLFAGRDWLIFIGLEFRKSAKES